MKALPFLLFSLAAAVTPCLSNPVAELRDLSHELEEPVVARDSSGRMYAGTLKRISKSQISLTTRVDEGEVTYRFHREDISTLKFPGQTFEIVALDLLRERRTDKALEILETLYTHRSPYFEFMKKEDVLFFLRLVDGYEESDQHISTIAVARRLLEFSPNDKVAAKLESSILLAFFHLDMEEEALALAHAWIARSPIYHSSSLGWWIASQIALERSQFEKALHLSLHPIVFSGPLAVSYLENCYSVAIAASKALQKDEKAACLLHEMIDRSIVAESE